MNYIVDFYCPAASLVIECDGGQHFTDDVLEADRIRDDALAQFGLKVLRFDNGQVMGRIDDVVDRIYQFIQQESPFVKAVLSANLIAIVDSRSSSFFLKGD